MKSNSNSQVLDGIISDVIKVCENVLIKAIAAGCRRNQSFMIQLVGAAAYIAGITMGLPAEEALKAAIKTGTSVIDAANAAVDLTKDVKSPEAKVKKGVDVAINVIGKAAYNSIPGMTAPKRHDLQNFVEANALRGTISPDLRGGGNESSNNLNVGWIFNDNGVVGGGFWDTIKGTFKTAAKMAGLEPWEISDFPPPPPPPEKGFFEKVGDAIYNNHWFTGPVNPNSITEVAGYNLKQMGKAASELGSEVGTGVQSLGTKIFNFLTHPLTGAVTGIVSRAAPYIEDMAWQFWDWYHTPKEEEYDLAQETADRLKAQRKSKAPPGRGPSTAPKEKSLDTIVKEIKAEHAAKDSLRYLKSLKDRDYYGKPIAAAWKGAKHILFGAVDGLTQYKLQKDQEKYLQDLAKTQAENQKILESGETTKSIFKGIGGLAGLTALGVAAAPFTFGASLPTAALIGTATSTALNNITPAIVDYNTRSKLKALPTAPVNTNWYRAMAGNTQPTNPTQALAATTSTTSTTTPGVFTTSARPLTTISASPSSIPTSLSVNTSAKPPKVVPTPVEQVAAMPANSAKKLKTHVENPYLSPILKEMLKPTPPKKTKGVSKKKTTTKTFNGEDLIQKVLTTYLQRNGVMS